MAIGCDPVVMGIGLAIVIPTAIKAARLQIGDIDIFEINELL